MVRLSLGNNHDFETEGLEQHQINTLSQVADEINDNMEETMRLAEAYEKLLKELQDVRKLLKEKDDQLQERRRGETDDIMTYKTKQARVTAELQALVDKLTGEVAIKDGDIQLRDLDISDKERKIAALALSEKEAKESEQRAQEDHAAENTRLRNIIGTRDDDIAEKDAFIADLRAELKRQEDVTLDAENRLARVEKLLEREREEHERRQEDIPTADGDVDRLNAHLEDIAEKDAQIYALEMAVAAKRDAVEAAEQQQHELKHRVAALEDDLEEAREETKRVVARGEDDARAKVEAAVREQTAKAEEFVEKHTADVEQLKRLAAEADARAAEERARVDDLEAAEAAREARYCAMVVELEQALRNADRAAEEIEAVKDRAEDDRQQLEGDLERMAGEANERAEALRDMNARVAGLLTEVDEAKAEGDAARAKAEGLSADLAARDAQLDECRAQHSREMDALKATLEKEKTTALAEAAADASQAADDARRRHEEDVEAMRAQQDALVAAATDEKAAEVEDMQRQLANMAESLAQKQTEVDRVDALVQETEQKHLDMKRDTELAKLRADKAVEDKARAEASYARELDRLAGQVQQRTDELQRQADKHAEVVSELREAQAQARAAEAGKVSLERRVEDAKAELENAQRRGHQAADEMKREHIRQLDAGAERTSRLNDELLERDAKVEAAEADLAIAKDEMNDASRRADELARELQRAKEDADDMAENLQSVINLRNQQLLAKEAALEEVEQEMKAARDAVRDADHRADVAERQADRSAQDLRLVRATMQAEVIRQGAALEAASYKAREAILQGQQQKADNVQLATKNTELELEVDELGLEKERLTGENERLREELDASRTAEGELQINIRKLELRNTQQEGAMNQMKLKLQERQRGMDNERADVEKLADAVQQATDRLRDANTKIEHIFLHGNSVEEQGEDEDEGAAPIALSKSGRIVIDFPVVPHHDRTSPDYEEAVLPDEVDKVEGIIDQLAALMEVHHWERQEDATRAAQDRLKQQEGLDGAHRKNGDLETRLKDLEQKYQDELARRAFMEKCKDFEKSEEASRAHIVQSEEDESGILASGARVAKLHQLQNKLESLQYSESDKRLDIEDLEAAEWNLLMNDAEDEYDSLIEQLRRRRLRELKQREKQKKTAYMGLEVSEGIVLKTNKKALEEGRKVTMMMNGKAVNTDVEGVRIFNVAPNGPADLAGLTTDDVILRVDGKKTLTLSDFKGCAKKVKPGDSVLFKIWREGEEVRVPVQTIEVNEDEFEQGTRRRIGHRVTILKELKGDRNQARDAREARRKELRSSMSRLGRVSGGSAMSREDLQEIGDTVPQDVRGGSPGSDGTPPRHYDAAATCTLAGANGGPMTTQMFRGARQASGFNQYKEVVGEGNAAAAAAIELANKRASTASPRKDKSVSPSPFLRERTNSIPDFMRPTKSAAQKHAQ